MPDFGGDSQDTALLSVRNTFSARQDWAKGADIASAAALTLGVDGNSFVVTGTTTITSVSSAPAGVEVLLRFSGALTVTHNATTLILAGGVNMVTVAGDQLRLYSDGSGNWRESGRRRVRVQEDNKGADIASAATVTFPVDGDYFHITGTTTITAFAALQAGTRILLEFDGALTLTHNATSLILIGGVNYVTVAGDVLEFVSEGSGNWREVRGPNLGVAVGVSLALSGAMTIGTTAANAGVNRFRHLQSMARVTNASGTQNVASATITPVTFATEDFDTDGLHDTSSNTSRLTAAIAGKYLATGGIYWSAQAPGTLTFVNLFLRINGATIVAGSRSQSPPISTFSTNGQGQSIAALVSLSAGDYVELCTYQDSSGTLTLGSALSALSMVYAGE
jgi:hypothetical protein